MNEQVQQLINEAKLIAIKNKNAQGRTKYPIKLKKIIFSLVNDYGVRPKDIMSFIPISAYSVRTWSYVKKSKPGFNQVQLSKPGSVASSRPKKRTLNHIGIQLIFLSAQVLLLAWQLSRH